MSKLLDNIFGKTIYFTRKNILCKDLELNFKGNFVCIYSKTVPIAIKFNIKESSDDIIIPPKEKRIIHIPFYKIFLNFVNYNGYVKIKAGTYLG